MILFEILYCTSGNCIEKRKINTKWKQKSDSDMLDTFNGI